ncbi:DNA N6-methyl adenine demethylase (N6-methyl adenine demethylase 1) [Durusdinium trenchii]|uniref:DNA N6-methyl adenine demethylase (N6-methyl adenine demethylase 1) n=1 Tax=Durusdinium trenchii TaxID=1381693 RepID=A0ABP0HEW6_9DINO
MERQILQSLQSWPWQPSQSGRWKQDFGPKANFKKQQVKIPETWEGFPSCSHQLLELLRGKTETLRDFEAVECLSLWYDSDRGASHALHVDDLWLWGQRIVGVSLQSPSIFTFFDPVNSVCVRVPLPQRSAYLINGRVRVDWQHGILAEDIWGPRVAMTFRELTEPMAQTELGRQALERAKLPGARGFQRSRVCGGCFGLFLL